MAAVDQATSVMLNESDSHKSNNFTMLHQNATPVTDHPLKNDLPNLEEIAKYVMMPKGVALAAPFLNTSISKEESVSRSNDLHKEDDGSLSLEGLGLELPAIKEFKETVPFPKSPRELRRTWEAAGIPLPREGAPSPAGDEEEDHSLFEAVLSPDLKDVRLLKAAKQPGSGESSGSGKRRVPLPPELRKWIAPDSETNTETTVTEEMHTAQDYISDTDTELDDLDSQDELEDSILEQLDENPDTSTATTPIPVLSATEERNESRNWRVVVVGGEEKRVDMKVIEPYKRVLSHGGYLSAGSHNAIIIFSACFLPDNSRVDYDYVMDNLFLYVMMTLEQLITEDYVLVFLQGATPRSVVPNLSWLKRCHNLIDRKLRKNLQKLYLVHPSNWLKLLVVFIKYFTSSKLSKKLRYVNSLAELSSLLPLEQASIPDRVKQYDAIKQSMPPNRKSRKNKV